MKVITYIFELDLYFFLDLETRYVDYVDGSIMTDGTFYDVAGQSFGQVFLTFNVLYRHFSAVAVVFFPNFCIKVQISR